MKIKRAAKVNLAKETVDDMPDTSDYSDLINVCPTYQKVPEKTPTNMLTLIATMIGLGPHCKPKVFSTFDRSFVCALYAILYFYRF